jgi:hypothetical protein
MKRRITLLMVVAVAAAMLLMASAMALATTIDCSRDIPCRVTPKKDSVPGTTDEMLGLGGDGGREQHGFLVQPRR